MVAPADTTLDARPYLPRNAVNPISTAEAVRDEVYDELTAFCEESGVEGLLAKSPPFSPEVWVRLEVWRKLSSRDDLSARASALVKIKPRPFHRFPHEVELECERFGRKKTYGPLAPLSQREIRHLVSFLVGSRDGKLRLTRLRASYVQLWRPRNRIEGIRRDALLWVCGGLAAAAFIAWFIGGALAGFLFAVASIGGLIWYVREPKLILSTGRPQQEPRRLIRLDSWQTVLRAAASEADGFMESLHRELEGSGSDEARLSLEDIWYWGVDGKEERRQLVVTFRRAVAFIHVYGYQHDLFVGWDAHVNAGTWSEVRVGGGIDRGSGYRVRAHSIESGWHIPNEYDITDASYLSEWIHAVMVQRVKETIERLKIEQEIDFAILREDRQGVAGRRDKSGGGDKPSLAKLFRRMS